MTKCKLHKVGVTKWTINPHEVGHSKIPGNATQGGNKKRVIDSMMDQVEYAGTLKLVQKTTKDCDGHKCVSTVSNFVCPSSLVGGKGMSVKSPKGLCNFHTHPLYCYEGAGSPNREDLCIWGWPSGEDMRESIVFAMKGNLIHLIFAMEGVYAVQVNPWIVDYLIKRVESDNLRGMLVCVIENYFKSTHGFRNCVYNQPKGKNICTPYDWMTFANNFNFGNLTETTKERCTKRLSCRGTPNTGGQNISWRDFLYDWDIENYHLTKKGLITERNSANQKHVKLLEGGYDFFVKGVNALKAQPGWKQGQLFKVTFSHNHIKGIGTIKELLKKGPSTRDIYNLWTSFRNNPELVKFGTEEIKFETPKVLTKGPCKLK